MFRKKATFGSLDEPLHPEGCLCMGFIRPFKADHIRHKFILCVLDIVERFKRFLWLMI